MDQIDYSSTNIIEIEMLMSASIQKVVLTGRDLTLSGIISVAYKNSRFSLTNNRKSLKRMLMSHKTMMADIRSGKPVYGCNTSYGGQAARVLNIGIKEKRLSEARKLSEGLIFLDVGTGPEVSSEIVKAAMLIRINMLLQGVSAVRVSTLELLSKMIEKNLIPVVNEYGGISASGDLIHNQRIVSAARGIANTYLVNEKGEKELASEALKRHKLQPLKLDPKEGLGLVNGDNFSTAFAVDVVYKLIQYFIISSVVGAMTIEVLKGTNRSFHPLLGSVRPHQGQQEVASIYRYLLDKSSLAYQELTGHHIRQNGFKVQDAYSLRCLSQFEGIYLEKIKWALSTITINANSVSDNPLWVPPEFVYKNEVPWQWVSGGNFLAMHMVEVLDTLRKITTQLIKKHDRHLARLIDETDNNSLGANLSDADKSITQCTFKGIQIQSGMFEIYSMLLANPISTLFGTHEERNQDITAHATTSGVLALKNLELLRYSLSGMLLAIAQGTDLRGGPNLLSPRTRPLYNLIRKYTPRVTDDRPLHDDLEQMSELIDRGILIKTLREEVFKNYNEK